MFEKYLITGGTGFLGHAVIAELINKNADIYALVLKDDPLADELPEAVNRVFGDVCDKASLEEFFKDADEKTCVLHCAGIVSVASDPGDKIYRVNVGGTKNIVRMCINKNVGKLVYVSSVHAIPEKPKGVSITEKTVFSPDLVKGDYAKSKAIATNIVLDAAKDGLNASVVFPSGIIGPGDTGKGSITSMLISFLAGKLPLAVKGGYDFVDVRDVAKGIINCAKKGVPGHGYILSGHYASVKDILETVKLTVKIKRIVSYLPIGFAKAVAPLYEKYSLFKKKPLYFTPYSVAVLASNGIFSHRAATDAFGYSPRPLKNTLKDTVIWLQGRKNMHTSHNKRHCG